MTPILRVGRRAAPWLLLGTALVGAGVLLRVHAPSGALPAAARVAKPVAADDWAGRGAPDFQLPALDGRRVRLSDFRGRVVLINFWATWCAPCRIEMPWLTQFDARYRGRGLTILGISVDDGGRERVERFVRERNVGYPILLDDANVEARYGGVRFLPQTFFVGRDGRILHRVYGIRTGADFEADIRSALGLQ